MSNAMKRMMVARTTLVLDQPFWGTLALKLALLEDHKCPTAWVDGQTLGFNPTFVEKLPTMDQVTALVAHEVCHCAHGHPWRRGGRDFSKWNEACDRALNPELRMAGFTLPDGALFELDATHAGKSAEWIYNRLPSNNEGGRGKKGEGEGDQQSQGQSSDQGNGNGDEPSQNPLGEVREPQDGGSGGDDASSEEEWRQAVHQAASLAKAQGKLPAGMERFVQQTTAGRVDWRSVLRRFFQEVARDDYSWVLPNRRYIGMGLYLPALHSHAVGPMVLAIDTSGSIDPTLLNIFTTEVKDAVREVRPRRVHVMYCDATVHTEDVFERDEEITVKPAGGGGTDFRPVFARVEQLEEPPVAVVYLTDLMGAFPEHVTVPVLWATPSRYAQSAVPFGEVVAIEE